MQAAAQNGGGYINFHREFGDYAAANAAGYTYNTLHMSATGYAKEAATYGELLTRIVS